jgi:DNA-binding transcriptional LysR family regulator
MYLLSLTTLKRIIDQGSYSSAAASLFMSQPSASNHIRQLERAFGAKLIEISGRNLQLTDVGKVVYELASRVETEFDQAHREIDYILGRSKRHITVVSNSASLLHRLPPVIKDFLSEHPEIAIKTLKKSGYEITEAVKAGTADIGIQVSLYLDNSIESLPVWRDSIIACCSREHPIVEVKRIPPEMLCRQRLVVSLGRETRKLLAEWFEEQGVEPIDLMEVSSFEQVRVAVLEGLGIGLLPRHVVANDLISRQLVQLEIRDFEVSRGTYVIFRRNISEPAKWLIDEMVESAKQSAELGTYSRA